MRLSEEIRHSTGALPASGLGFFTIQEKHHASVRWTKKDERQYEHIKDGQEKRGTSEKRSKEIAARTVNKTRRKEGRTPNKTTQGTGNPNTKLEDRTVKELRNMASDMNIKGRSKLNKKGLVREISKRTIEPC